jgi:monofunctional biosynthetic peptidoglycan transglycosylase
MECWTGPSSDYEITQAALLAAVLPAPKRYRVDAPGPYVRKRQAWIERQMVALGGAAYLSKLG